MCKEYAERQLALAWDAWRLVICDRIAENHKTTPTPLPEPSIGLGAGISQIPGAVPLM